MGRAKRIRFRRRRPAETAPAGMLYNRAVIHQSSSDYPRAIRAKTPRTNIGVSGCKPMAIPCIYVLCTRYTRRRAIFPSADLRNRLAGERDFRDFSCLPPAKENRGQPADPAPATATRSTNFIEDHTMSTDSGKQNEMEPRPQVPHQHPSGRTEGLRRHRRAPQGRHPQALLPRRVAQTRQLPRRARKRAPPRRRPRRQGTGTTAGTLHRVWGDLKAKLGGGDHTLLETAEQGEDVAKEAYKTPSTRTSRCPSASSSQSSRPTSSPPTTT